MQPIYGNMAKYRDIVKALNFLLFYDVSSYNQR
jgi:hypothetical protein